MPNKHGKTPILFGKRKNSYYGVLFERIGAGYFKVIKEICILKVTYFQFCPHLEVQMGGFYFH